VFVLRLCCVSCVLFVPFMSRSSRGECAGRIVNKVSEVESTQTSQDGRVEDLSVALFKVAAGEAAQLSCRGLDAGVEIGSQLRVRQS